MTDQPTQLDAQWQEEAAFRDQYLPRLEPNWRKCRYCSAERVPTFVPRKGQPGAWILESEHECLQGHHIPNYVPLVITNETFEASGEGLAEPLHEIVPRYLTAALGTKITPWDLSRSFMSFSISTGKFNEVIAALERHTNCRLNYDLDSSVGDVCHQIWRCWLQQGAEDHN